MHTRPGFGLLLFKYTWNLKEKYVIKDFLEF